MKMKNRKCHGLTLIEIMIAIFLVTVVFATVIAVYPALYRHATMSKNRFLAASVADNIIETIRAVPWGAPVPAYVRQDKKLEQLVEGEKQEVTFKVKEINFEPSNSTGNGPKPDNYVCLVTVTLEWVEGVGSASQAKTKTLTSQGTITRN